MENKNSNLLKSPSGGEMIKSKGSKAKSPPKNKKQNSPGHKKSQKSFNTGKNVDLVTGNEVVSVYFDPSKILESQNFEYDWIGKHFYSPASVIKVDGDVTTVALPNGEMFKMKSACRISSNDAEGVDDILKLRDFSEMSLIHTLRVRYFKDEIYTFVGPILISINPYKLIKDIYSDKTINYYSGKKQNDLPPHLFSLAEAAFASLMNSRHAIKPKDQSIIISGESGAGKTEATKFIMTYLARISTNRTAVLPHDAAASTNDVVHSSTGVVNEGELEDKILKTNPLLEAFGNARTLRNDNSSRFGKFIKIQFSKYGRIVGATIEKYLLEKTRIIFQSSYDGERNFHIFYQLLRSGNQELMKELSLDSTNIQQYRFVSNGKSPTSSSTMIPNVSDEHDFQVTCNCMTNIGITTTIQREIFQLVAGIIHLGNVQFTDNNDEEHVSEISAATQQEFEIASKLFGLDPSEFLNAMTKQNMYVNGATIVKNQTQAQAMDKRNSFAKSIYSMLFSWLVDRINMTIAPSDVSSAWGFIGLLDIYGFENFDHANSFEQLLINYANEKMQNHFNKHIFQIEQAEYENESIDWSYIQFNDNQACVDLIDNKPFGKTGIFQTLDDSIGSGRVDVNCNFLATLNQSWSGSVGSSQKHSNYVAPRFNSDQKFGILHYAGEVFYDITGFAEKNRDSMNNDMKELMSKSTQELLRSIMDESMKQDAVVNASRGVIAGGNSSTSSNNGASNNNKIGKKSGSITRSNSVLSNKLKEDSISKQFTISLKQLYETLDATEPHFIRCVKPNTYKKSHFFNAQESLLQLKYAGMLETIRIRQQGYALRLLHKDFYYKYSCLVMNKGHKYLLKDLVAELSKVLAVSAESWQVGTTKIFIRRDLSNKLDKLLWIRYSRAARTIQNAWNNKIRYHAAKKVQKYIRRFVAKSKYQRFSVALRKLQSYHRRNDCIKAYQFQYKAVVTMQRICYGYLTRKVAKKLRNPYNRMTYEELTTVLKKTETELKQAFELKDFMKCSELEGHISDIREARSRLPLPKIIPTSRKEVELFIMEITYAIEVEREDAIVNVNHCLVALEERLKELEGYRTQFPTIEEVNVKLTEAKTALQNAMSKKEFKKCGELQQRVSQYEQEIKAIELSNQTDLSVDDLKAKKSDLEMKITSALDAKNFDLCSSLQVELDQMVDILSRKDLTLDLAQARYETIQYEMKVCRENKEFLRMAEIYFESLELQKLVEKLQLASIPVVPVVVEEVKPTKTYEEVTNELADLEQQLTVAISKKQYTKCDEIEKSIKSLQELRATLPVPERKYTRSELESMLQQKKTELEVSLKEKKYAQCDEIQIEIDKLQAKLDSMPTSDMIQKKIVAMEEELKLLISTKQYSKCGDVEKELELLKVQYEKLLLEEPPKPVKNKVVKARLSTLVATPIKNPVARVVKEEKPVMVAAAVEKPKPVVVIKKEEPKIVTKAKENERPVSKLKPKAQIGRAHV